MTFSATGERRGLFDSIEIDAVDGHAHAAAIGPLAATPVTAVNDATVTDIAFVAVTD